MFYGTGAASTIPSTTTTQLPEMFSSSDGNKHGSTIDLQGSLITKELCLIDACLRIIIHHVFHPLFSIKEDISYLTRAHDVFLNRICYNDDTILGAGLASMVVFVSISCERGSVLTPGVVAHR